MMRLFWLKLKGKSGLVFRLILVVAICALLGYMVSQFVHSFSDYSIIYGPKDYV